MGKCSTPIQGGIGGILGHLSGAYGLCLRIASLKEFEMVVSLQGVVAQVLLADLQFGSYLSISVVTGIAAMLGILIAGPVSGGHLNPSVTLAFVVFRRFSPKKAVLYFIGQVRRCLNACEDDHF